MFMWDSSVDGSMAINRVRDDVCVYITIAHRAAETRREKPTEYRDKTAQFPGTAGTSAACRY